MTTITDTTITLEEWNRLLRTNGRRLTLKDKGPKYLEFTARKGDPDESPKSASFRATLTHLGLYTPPMKVRKPRVKKGRRAPR